MNNNSSDLIRNSDVLEVQRLPFNSIPIIDLSPLLAGDRQQLPQTLQAIDRACREVGFFYIRNHGISEALIAHAFQQAEAFFALPQAQKLELDINKLNYFRGYVAFGDAGEPAQFPDIQEALELGLELPPDDPDFLAGHFMYGPNVWSSALPEMQTAIYSYFEAVLHLGHQLFRAFALILGLNEDFFEDKLTKPMAQMRLIYYPPQEQPPVVGNLGMNPHYDFETFTILAQTQDGLQAQNPLGEWIEVPHIPGTLVINLGEMMTRWTNGRYVPTPHRVLSPSTDARYSMPFFFGLNYDAVVSVLPTCQSPDHPPQYAPVTTGEWTVRRIRDTYFLKARQ